MKTAIRPLAEVSHQAKEILVREMGVVDTVRFLSQFGTGAGDYTKERGQWLDNLTFDEVVTQIKAKRRKPRRANGRS